jgi:hypothetical protein
MNNDLISTFRCNNKSHTCKKIIKKVERAFRRKGKRLNTEEPRQTTNTETRTRDEQEEYGEEYTDEVRSHPPQKQK